MAQIAGRQQPYGYSIEYRSSGKDISSTINSLKDNERDSWIVEEIYRIYNYDKRVLLSVKNTNETSNPDTSLKITPTPSRLPSENTSVSTESAQSFDYTTNGSKTYKDGNQGIYAYRQNAGSYYNYWIIDFNEGYVYSFSDGNGSKSGEKARITSGDLSNKLVVTYQDGDEVWSHNFYFKNKNQPSVIIFEIEDGYDWHVDCNSTDLKKALELMNLKRITDLTPVS